jgi:hypothetical protein
MSALRATATPAPVAPPRAAQRPRGHEHLSVVPGPVRRAARGPFIAFLAAILALGLLALLALNTVLAKGSFAVYDLRAESARLADREQALLQQVAAAESPEQLESAARGLGMVPAQNPVFLRLADGKVLGVPVAATAPPKPKPVAKPKPKPTPAAPVVDKKSARPNPADADAVRTSRQGPGDDR